MNVELISWTKNPLMTCAKAASMCYKSEPTLTLIKGCIKSHHESVLEHASFTFMITGVSRSCSHQIVRHRISSYSQESQRYVNVSDPEWVLPVASNTREAQIMVESCEHSLAKYEELENSGCSKDEARCVLPNATPTSLVMTMNIRSLTNFFNERLCSRASKEIREVAQAMKKVIHDCPDLSEMELAILDKLFVPKCERFDLPFCPEYKGCGKHKTLKELVGENNE